VAVNDLRDLDSITNAEMSAWFWLISPTTLRVLGWPGSHAAVFPLPMTVRWPFKSLVMLTLPSAATAIP
jgi:hypothetical protein